jgi:hypothetical protein
VTAAIERALDPVLEIKLPSTQLGTDLRAAVSIVALRRSTS